MVTVDYHTDPACPWSWAAEPRIRALMMEFGEDLRWRLVMGGLAREVAPRLRNMAGSNARYAVDDRLLGADWTLGDGSRLHLIANLVEAARERMVPPQGRVVYASIPNPETALTERTLPGWTVVWTLEDTGV